MECQDEEEKEHTYNDRLGVSLDVGEEEVIETNLASKETGHVNLVCVESAVENLAMSRIRESKVRTSSLLIP